MFSQEPRCIYRLNQVSEVKCQLRFPEIPSIGANPPTAFRKAIEDEFPQFASRQESLPPKITGAPGNFFLQNQPNVINYEFVSADGKWKINLTGNFITLSCAHYTCWEDFAKKLDKPLATFIKLYQPAHFDRVGLRYLNFISRKALGLENTPFRELIEGCYLGPLAEEDVLEANAQQCTVDVNMAIRGGCRLNLHAGPGLIKRNGQPDPELKFILDMDLSMPGKIPVNLSAGALNTVHSQAYGIFRGAITDQLHSAMEPEMI